MLIQIQEGIRGEELKPERTQLSKQFCQNGSREMAQQTEKDENLERDYCFVWVLF